LVERAVRIGWDRLGKFPELRVILPEGLNFAVKLPRLGKPYHEVPKEEIEKTLEPGHVSLPSRRPSEAERKKVLDLVIAHWETLRGKLRSPSGQLRVEWV